MNIFFNMNNDTIRFNTKALLNDKWMVFSIIDSLQIEATIINYDTMSFMGLRDSVKTIGFQVYDESMNPLDYDINDMHIQISKTSGFLQVFNFSLFPNLQVDYPTEELEEYYLIGLSNPQVGIQNLTWFQVNDFQVGDELHVLDESSHWAGYTTGYAITNKAIYKYFERTDYEDSIVYFYSREQSINTIWEGDSTTFKYNNDTIKSIITSNKYFDQLPGEPVIIDNETYQYYMNNGTNLSKSNPWQYETFFFSGDSCWDIFIADGCLYCTKYIKGLVLDIYNIDGRIIRTYYVDSKHTQININDFEAGVYLYRLSDKNRVIKINNLIIE